MALFCLLSHRVILRHNPALIFRVFSHLLTALNVVRFWLLIFGPPYFDSLS